MPTVLQIFQTQLLLQCKYVVTAAAQINDALKEKNVEWTFYCVQSMLTSAANISKMLWGQGGKLAEKRKPIRDSIGILDDSPLRDVTMRNHYEHLDERLERWMKESKERHFIDLNIVPKSKFSEYAEIGQFRALDSATMDLVFWGQEFNLRKLLAEVEKIIPKLAEAVEKTAQETKN